MSTKETFGRNLRNRLTVQRRTQADLARHLKTTRATVTRWVNGECLPRPQTIDAICHYLNCTTDELMTDTSKPVSMLPQDIIAEEIENNPRLMRLMFYYMKMSNDELDKEIERLSK